MENAKVLAISEYKKNLKASEKTARKPELYHPGKDIKSYMTAWDYYKNVMDLSDDQATQVFFTFLDEYSHQKLKVLEVHRATNLKLGRFQRASN